MSSGHAQRRRRLVALSILAAGFGCALVIYFTATPAIDNPPGYEPADSKQYLREIAVYGGTANLLATEFRLWFGSLWHGRRLAVTVVCLTLVLVLFYLVASTPLSEQVRLIRLEVGGPGPDEPEDPMPDSTRINRPE